METALSSTNHVGADGAATPSSRPDGGVSTGQSCAPDSGSTGSLHDLTTSAVAARVVDEETAGRSAADTALAVPAHTRPPRGSDSAMLPSVEIRDAVASDWVDIWGFMQPILSIGDTYCWPGDTTEIAARTWWMNKPSGRVLVAVVDGAVVGTAEIHPNQPAAGNHIANAGFMVAGKVAGQGIGRALAQRVLATARDDGYTAMQFNAVVETNAAAVKLWRSLGFEILATVPRAFRHPEHGLVGLHVMHRWLR